MINPIAILKKDEPVIVSCHLQEVVHYCRI
jgi:hypothetical protein